ncbi:hypothetical protein RHDC4_00661 [Rhodocyclaceae bacterium]|nr:hypothetical protein RHDC4_00661 [Rhodocyclaceae bacterium]
MSSWSRILFACIAALFVVDVYAQEAITPNNSIVIEAINAAAASVTETIVSQSIRWLSALMLLQFVMTNYKLLPHAELDSVFAKFVGSLMLFGVCWYILGAGAELIQKIGYGIYGTYAPSFPSPSAIIATTVGLVAGLTTVAMMGGVFSPTFGQAILYLVLALALIGLFFAMKLYLLELELALVVMLSPLSFSLLGLNALRDQGIAPFKSLLSLVYRIIIYGIIFTAYNKLTPAMADVVEKYAGMSNLAAVVASGWVVIKALFALLVGYVLLFMLLFKSDSIAASLASGSTNLGPADIAGAAMAGAAAGSLMAKMAEQVTKPVESMSDWMKQLGVTGQTGMRNASSTGGADLGAAPLKPDVTSSSLSGGAADNGAPSAGPADTTAPAAQPPSPGTSDGGEFGGVPNASPGGESRDADRDAARAARRQERTGSGANAGIEGGLTQQVGELVNAMNNPKGRTMGDHARDWHQQVAQEKAGTHVSINTHHE